MANKDEQIAFRVDAATKAALLKAAMEDNRALSSLMGLIVARWLKERGKQRRGQSDVTE
jgi:hypothetical protein